MGAIVCGLLFVAAQATPLTHGGPQSGDSTATRVLWSPPRPEEGSILRVTVRPATELLNAAPALVVRGNLAGQPLHFESDPTGHFHALGGVAVGAPDSVQATIAIESGAQLVQRITVKVPVTRVRTPVQRLTVDRRFLTPPESALPRIQAERDSVRAVSNRSHDTARLWHDSFLRPRPTRITGAFGQRREYNGEFLRIHMGVDMAGTTGAPVIATNRGVVVLAADFYYAGNAIYLDHGQGLTTAYMHLSEIGVAVGDTVARGAIIGRVGATGRVTGPHLHWNAQYGTVTLNPLSLLDLDVSVWATSGAGEP